MASASLAEESMDCGNCGKPWKEGAAGHAHCKTSVQPRPDQMRPTVLEADPEKRETCGSGAKETPKLPNRKMLRSLKLGALIAAVALAAALGGCTVLKGKIESGRQAKKAEETSMQETGARRQEASSEETAKEADESGNKEATLAYEAFLRNERGVVAKDGRNECPYSEVGDRLEKGRAYSLSELIGMANESFFGPEAQCLEWAYIDCGGDGRPELAVRVSELDNDAGGSYVTYVIGYQEGELYLYLDFRYGYRTNAELGYFGNLTIGGSNSASSWCDNLYVLTEDGQIETIYSLNVYGEAGEIILWSFKNDALKEWYARQNSPLEGVEAYEYVIGDETCYVFHLYDAASGQYQPFDSRAEEFYGNDGFRQFYQKCVELNGGWEAGGMYREDEIDEKIRQRKKELNLGEELFDDRTPEWTRMDDAALAAYASGTAGPLAAPQQASFAARIPAASEISGLIESICLSGGNPLLDRKEDPSGMCRGFILSAPWYWEQDKMLARYPDAYMQDSFLYLSESSLKDFLRNSVGMDTLDSILSIAGNLGEPYLGYRDGVFSLVGRDTGDQWQDPPVITEITPVSEREIRVSGTIRGGIWQDYSETSAFTLRMTANPDSIWGGYTLSSIERWDVIERTEATDENLDYLIPYSDSSYLLPEDIAGWSESDLRKARNEIYARHGRIFKDEELRQYFESKSWYQGTVSPEAFSESVLNDYERANLKLITDYEKKMGYR